MTQIDSSANRRLFESDATKLAMATSSSSLHKTTELNNNNNNDYDIKLKIYYEGLITVMYSKHELSLDNFFSLVRKACKFDPSLRFTVKWVDEEGDPCTISSQTELDEALRLYALNKESELVIHIFASEPERPGLQCAGEDRSIYRRGARRWRKIYLVNGHKYQAKRFARTALCIVCKDRIWGLGRQGYKCLECKTMVHKRCHKLINLTCNEIVQKTYMSHNANLSPSISQSPSNVSNLSFSNTNYESAPKINNNNNSNSNNAKAQQQLNIINDSPATSSSARSSLSLQKNVNSNTLVSISGSIKKYSVESEKRDTVFNELTPDDQEEQLDSKVSNDGSPAKSRQITLSDFEMLKVIGRGSYAKVFLVEYKRTAKCYAMKVIKKSMVNDDEDIDWVQTEKHVFEQATNHPFLVGLHSCFQTESRLFFVIEYLCGGDLMYHMQRKRKLVEDHARFYAAEIAIALDFLHSKGIIYRDLKLDNVLLDIDGHIKLTDYGMCKEGLGKGEKTSTFCGTPNYIAPEMLRGEEYGFSVDWWALGVLMFEMMAGRSPFELNENPSENPDLNTEDHLFQVILEKPIRIPRSLSPRAASILKAFLQKAPEERLGTHDGLREIRMHPYFKMIDWDLMEQKLITPPYKPEVENERDLTNIDKLFTNEPVILTPDSPNTLARIQQNEFEGFEYVNPLILSDELPV